MAAHQKRYHRLEKTRNSIVRQPHLRAGAVGNDLRHGLEIVVFHGHAAFGNDSGLCVAHAQVGRLRDHLIDVPQVREKSGVVVGALHVLADELPVQRVEIPVHAAHALHVPEKARILRADDQGLDLVRAVGHVGGELHAQFVVALHALHDLYKLTHLRGKLGVALELVALHVPAELLHNLSCQLHVVADDLDAEAVSLRPLDAQPLHHIGVVGCVARHRGKGVLDQIRLSASRHRFRPNKALRQKSRYPTEGRLR
eukprot:scaffold635_cov311-Pinguiococcus_pyrenoidosus.AAC.18